MKILFLCTHPGQGTGYGRVANKITNYLADQPGVEVVFYAFQNYRGQVIEDRFVDPRIKIYDAYEIDPESPKGFGDKGILPCAEKEKPDVLFLYNDLMVTTAILDILPDIPAWVYLDLVYPWERPSVMLRLRENKNVKRLWTFLECWREHLVNDYGFDKEMVRVMKHGVDFERFRDIDHDVAKNLCGFKVDDFVVLNMNRNSYRKGYDITIRAFLKFLAMNDFNPRLKLYLGCLGTSDDGYDIDELITTECLRQRLDISVVTKHIFTSPKPLLMSDETVNLLYNAADVGLNTCCGEGFGLTNVEHGYFNRHQIVSGVPALRETLGDFATMIEPIGTKHMSNFDKHNGVVMVFEAMDFAMALHECFHKKIPKPDRLREHVVKHYNWETILLQELTLDERGDVDGTLGGGEDATLGV
jgi:glycosyltransferase involved in cell wall biosynthesis